MTEDGRRTGYQGSGGYASNGWRRAGGTALMRLMAAGFAQRTGYRHGVPTYVLTDEGKEIGDGRDQATT